jgi:hypothetical protein
MKFVPGKALDQLIGRTGLRLNDALHYAIQVADALAAAVGKLSGNAGDPLP